MANACLLQGINLIYTVYFIPMPFCVITIYYMQKMMAIMCGYN